MTPDILSTRRPYQYKVDFTQLSEKELRHPTHLMIREVTRRLRNEGLEALTKPELRVLVNSLTLKKDSLQKMRFGIELLNTALDEYTPERFVKLIYPKQNTLDDTGELFKYDFRNNDRKILEKTWRKRAIKRWTARAFGWGTLGLVGLASVGAKQGTHAIDHVQGVAQVQEQTSPEEQAQPHTPLSELRAVLQFISDGIDVKLDPLFVLWGSALLLHEDLKSGREKEQYDIVEAANAISEIGERMKGKEYKSDTQKITLLENEVQKLENLRATDRQKFDVLETMVKALEKKLEGHADTYTLEIKMDEAAHATLAMQALIQANDRSLSGSMPI